MTTNVFDIYRAAKLVIDQNGEHAVDFALNRATQFYDNGDMKGAAVWRQIMKAVVELQRGRHTSARTLNAPKKHVAPIRERVTLELDGKFCMGSYTVEGGIITVEYDLHRLSARMNSTPALVLAEVMLRELVASDPPRKD